MFYEVPDSNAAGRVFDSISAEYLENRLEYLITRLKQRIGVTTAKHLSSYRKPAMKKTDDIRTKIAGAIACLNGNDIRSEEKLAEFCRVVDDAIDGFKSEHEGTVHGSQRILQMFIDEERKAIKSLVKLESAMKPKIEVHKEAENELEEADNLKREIRGLMVLKADLIANLAKAGEKEVDLSQAVEFIMKNFKAILYLFEKFANADEISKLPHGVQNAVIDEIEKMLSGLTKFREIVSAAGKMKEDSLNHSQKIKKLKAGIGYFSGLVHYRERSDLGEVEAELRGMESDLDEIDEIVKETGVRVEAILDQADLVFQMHELREVIKRIVNIFPQDEARLINFFENPKIAAVQAADIPAVKEVCFEEIGGGHVCNFIDNRGLGFVEDEYADEDDNANATTDVKKYFRWQNALPDKASAEVRRRLNANPLFRDLAKNERWLDLRLALELMTLKDYHDLGLSSSCVGSSKAYFQSKEDLIDACFPEMAGLKPVFPSVQKTGKSAPRFRWSGMNKTAEDLRSEVKARMFAGWPLLGELYESQKWTELRYLFDKFNMSTMAAFRIRRTCVGDEDSPYETLESMLKEVFPEAY